MIPLFKVAMSTKAIEEAIGALRSGWVAEGPRVAKFERAFAAAVDSDRPVLATSSCTAALRLALQLADVGPGDEVITTPQTCVATNIGILHRGAVPVWADIDRVTGCILAESVADRITDRTKAIIAVDWAGRACDYGALKRVAAQPSHDVWLIEDAAHAFCAKRDDGKPIASDGGDLVCWSFQAIKHLTTGDGGALSVPAEWYRRAKRMRWFGLDRDAAVDFRAGQDIVEAGDKFHMNDIAASIGLGNLPSAASAVAAHRANARRYCEIFASFKSLEHVTVPPFDPGCSYWFFNLLVDDRASFSEHMQIFGVETSQVHARNDRLSIFAGARRPKGDLRGVDIFSDYQVALPCGWWLTGSDVQRVAEAVVTWAKR